jgi:hypothetical protein
MPRDLTDEVSQLLTYFEQRRLTEDESCAVMGTAIAFLLGTAETKRDFLRTLEKALFAH